MRRFLALTIALVLALCASAAAENANYTVGICQLVQHDALDLASQGFKDALNETMGDQIRLIEQNASGDSANCIAIVNSFIAEDVDLILANSTQALQAAYSATGDIPILGVSITDYAAALGMNEWTGVTNVNVSGASDLAPLADQAELIRSLFPDANEIGLLYCSAEANSEYQATIMSGLLTAMGYHCSSYTYTDSNDVFSVAHTACAASDVVFVPTDNTAASCAQVIRNVVEVEQTPIIGSEGAMCSTFSVAALTIDYYDLGYATGEMAYEILVNGADVSAMPIQYIDSLTYKYNPELCEMLGVNVPEGWEAVG